MKSSQQLERETEATRAQLEHTFDELRARLTPGQVVDQVVDYARDGKAGVYFSNLGQQAVNNPLPIALIGAGIAWLMMSGASRPRLQTAGYSNGGNAGRTLSSVTATARKAANTVGGVAGAVSDATQATTEAISEAGASLRDASSRVGATASDAAARISDATSSAYNSAAAGVDRSAARVAQSASELGHHTADSARGLVTFLREQPLVLAGLGLAIGAAVGAAFPATEVEDRVMGAASDSAKDHLTEVKERITEAASDVASPAHSGGEDHNDDDAQTLHADNAARSEERVNGRTNGAVGQS
jgi:hypothetical protein